MGKKGISPIVAMILLIVITIVAAGLMASWARQYINEKTENVTSEESSLSRCLRMGIDIVSYTYDSASDEISLVLQNSQFETINRIDIKMVSTAAIYNTNDLNFTVGDPNTVLRPSDITLIKINTTNMPAANYTLMVTPDSCPSSGDKKTIEVM